MGEFYNPCRLASMRDIDGKVPNYYMLTGNRTAGKTFGIKALIWRRYVKKGEKFAILVRYGKDIKGMAGAFFKDIGELKFNILPEDVTQVTGTKDVFDVFVKNKHVGYVIALSAIDNIKRMSSNFVDVDNIFFDEFSSESGRYLKNEPEKLESILTSVARGKGKHLRHVSVWMCSNDVTVTNPYFIYWDITKRLKPDTKMLRGRGFVLEQTFNKEAAKALENVLNKDGKYYAYATGASYLLDNSEFVEKFKGQKYTVGTLEYCGKKYGIWNMRTGEVIISQKYDPSCKNVYAMDLDSHRVTSTLVKGGKIVKILTKMFSEGDVFFENQICKNAFLDMLKLSEVVR